MFLPRWIVALLFLTSIGSLSGVIYLLVTRDGVSLTDALPEATVVVSAPPDTSAVETKEGGVAREEDLMLATAKWEEHEEKSLNLKFEYPESWTVRSENGVLLISDPQSLTKSASISRADRNPRSLTLANVVKARKDVLEKDSAVKELKEETLKVDEEYDAVLLKYVRGDVATQELIFVTRSYIYTVVMVPDNEELAPVFKEIVDSLDIV